MSELTKEKLDELERMWTEAQPILRGAPTLAGSELALREGVAVGNYLVTMNAQVPALLSAAREVETLRAQLRDVTAERDEYKAQRDELQKAAMRLLDAHFDDEDDEKDDALSALEAATGWGAR